MKRSGLWCAAGLAMVGLALFAAGPAWALPDLVAWVASRGVPVERGGELIIPFSVTVQNLSLIHI